jgi:hypothetical protein
MKQFSMLFICLVILSTATATFAQTQSGQQTDQTQTDQGIGRRSPRPNRQGKNRGEKRRHRLAQMDTDQDQRISRDEWKRRPKGFDRLDSNGDGFITREEMAALREKRRKRNNANETKPPSN